MTKLRVFGGLLLQAALILCGAISMLVFARDGFQLFLHDAFNWLLAVGETILGSIFEVPAIHLAIERLLSGVELWLAGLGIVIDLYLQPHWKHAFVLLMLAFSGYAHAFKDFSAHPAKSTFRYANALLSAFAGGLMAGTVHLAHPGVVAWPLAAFLLFRGLNSLWRAIFDTSGARARLLALAMTALWLFGAVAIAAYVLHLPPAGVLPGQSASPGLEVILLSVVAVGVWATLFGFGKKKTRTSASDDEALNEGTEAPRWIENPGRRMGLRMLTTLGVASLVAGLGHAAWGLARAPASAHTGTPGAVFRDCVDCPDMVAIAAGNFTMGTTEEEKGRMQAAGVWNEEYFSLELPAREISVDAFAMGRTEVTLAQFEAFIEATGYRPSGICWGQEGSEYAFGQRIDWRHPGHDQGPNHPVVCITWWDAQAYVRWLSLRTGETYRLPSEAEWEYSARAGGQTAFFWGNDADAGCIYMNGADEQIRRAFPDWWASHCDDGALYTSPVASYQANPFGLFDVSGNVWEWVEDCYSAYDPLRREATAVTRGDCSVRILRGGSWDAAPQFLRSADRDLYAPALRSSSYGFRVARAL